MRIWAWIRRRIMTRKCKACGERYRRKLPYCPTCKTLPGYDGIERGGDWGHGLDLARGYVTLAPIVVPWS